MSNGDNEQLKKLINQLAKVINQALSTSPVVRKAVEAIRQDGYGVDLSLAACIGVYKDDPVSPEGSGQVAREEIKFELDEEDLEFLKAIKLRIES